MRISDANKLAGVIRNIKPGQDITEVQIDIGDQLVTASITSSAARDMNLEIEEKVFALFNSGDVTLLKD